MTRIELQEFLIDVEGFCRDCPYPCQGTMGQETCLLYAMKGLPGRAKLNHSFLDKLALPKNEDYETIRRIKIPRKFPKAI